jgi:hypothetical protein
MDIPAVQGFETWPPHVFLAAVRKMDLVAKFWTSDLKCVVRWSVLLRHEFALIYFTSLFWGSGSWILGFPNIALKIAFFIYGFVFTQNRAPSFQYPILTFLM